MRTPEDVMRNKCLPRDVEETEMMKHTHLDQGIVIETTHLLRVWLLLDKMNHLLNTPKQEVMEV